MQLLCQAVGGHTERFHKLGQQDISRMNRKCFGHLSPFNGRYWELDTPYPSNSVQWRPWNTYAKLVRKQELALPHRMIPPIEVFNEGNRYAIVRFTSGGL